jgi:hypothetical protein
MIGMSLSGLKINFNAVERVFIDSVKEQAELQNVESTTVALRIFPMELENIKGEYGVKVRVSSLSGAFEDSIIALKELTIYDQGNHISQAFMKIFENEVRQHNEYLANSVKSQTTINYGSQIDFDKLELFIQVKIMDGKEVLEMNMIYDYNMLRPYSIKEEFKDAEDHLKEM